MTATSAVTSGPGRILLPPGRMFLGRGFDHLAIGGGLSLVVFGVLAATGQLEVTSAAALSIPTLLLISNNAHFGASSVRLYTKAGAFRTWPFLTMGLPLATLAVLTAAMLWPRAVGIHLQALYLTWSPFHYAAQAFGLACMYHYRSGGRLGDTDRRLLFATCLLPFFVAFLRADTTGLGWLVPRSVFVRYPELDGVVDLALAASLVGTFLAPLALLLRLYLTAGRGLPFISLLIVFTNGVWWIVFSYYQAFVWATVFHGLQYLAIVMVFHVRDQMASPGNRRGPLSHALGFYLASFALGYLLFQVWPYAFLRAGFPLSEAILLCAAAINIHHFIVDRYIWRLRKDENYRVVVSAGPPGEEGAGSR